jgi:hypothetical protein
LGEGGRGVDKKDEKKEKRRTSDEKTGYRKKGNGRNTTEREGIWKGEMKKGIPFFRLF